MERDRALMMIGIILIIVGIIGLVLPVELILNLHQVTDYLVLIDPSDVYPYEPGNMLINSYFEPVYLSNFLEIVSISTVLVAIGLVGVLIRYRNYFVIIGIPGFLLSAQQSTLALQVYENSPWPLSLEYWTQMIPQINSAFLVFVLAYLVLGVTIIPTRTSPIKRIERGILGLGIIVISLSVLSILPFLTDGGRLWITQSLTSVLAMIVVTVLLLLYLSVPSTKKS